MIVFPSQKRTDVVGAGSCGVPGLGCRKNQRGIGPDTLAAQLTNRAKPWFAGAYLDNKIHGEFGQFNALRNNCFPIGEMRIYFDTDRFVGSRE